MLSNPESFGGAQNRTLLLQCRDPWMAGRKKREMSPSDPEKKTSDRDTSERTQKEGYCLPTKKYISRVFMSEPNLAEGDRPTGGGGTRFARGRKEGTHHIQRKKTFLFRLDPTPPLSLRSLNGRAILVPLIPFWSFSFLCSLTRGWRGGICPKPFISFFACLRAVIVSPYAPALLLLLFLLSAYTEFAKLLKKEEGGEKRSFPQDQVQTPSLPS